MSNIPELKFTGNTRIDGIIKNINDTIKEDIETGSFDLSETEEVLEYIISLIYYTIDDNLPLNENKKNVFRIIIENNKELFSDGNEELKDFIESQYSYLSDSKFCDKDFINFKDSQLEKTYERIIGKQGNVNHYIVKYDKVTESSKKIKTTLYTYFKYISNKPILALSTLLWFDSFHDFKESRIAESKDFTLNKIVKYFTSGKTIDVYYRDSFFEFNKEGKVKGFNNMVNHTVLKPCNEDTNNIWLSKLLYDLSDIFIKDKNFESDLLHTYMMYMFEFKFINEQGNFDRKKYFEQLNDISFVSIPSNQIPYWAKDVDNESHNFLTGVNVILPASIFDQNKGNSSNNPNYFVNIPDTVYLMLTVIILHIVLKVIFLIQLIDQ